MGSNPELGCFFFLERKSRFRSDLPFSDTPLPATWRLVDILWLVHTIRSSSFSERLRAIFCLVCAAFLCVPRRRKKPLPREKRPVLPVIAFVAEEGEAATTWLCGDTREWQPPRRSAAQVRGPLSPDPECNVS